MSRFMGDIALIPLLWFTAVHCRNHRVRWQAVKLLELSAHREGVWDAKLLGVVARRVVGMEEKGFYDSYEVRDGPFGASYRAQEGELPVLPMENRIDEVDVSLPDGSEETVGLVCRKRRDDGSWEVAESEYDMLSSSWTEKERWPWIMKYCSTRFSPESSESASSNISGTEL